MGYPTISDFDKIFIKRTKENLDCKVKNNYTHLMNSLLGLIILPRQWTMQGKRNPEVFSKKVVDVFPFLKGSNDISDEINSGSEIKKLQSPHQAIEDITIETLIDRLRNSIAHQSLRPTLSDRNDWAGVVFRNYKHDKHIAGWRDNFNMQVYFTMDELKEFVTTISDEYLKSKT